MMTLKVMTPRMTLPAETTPRVTHPTKVQRTMLLTIKTKKDLIVVEVAIVVGAK